jgi:hypothetical protein
MDFTSNAANPPRRHADFFYGAGLTRMLPRLSVSPGLTCRTLMCGSLARPDHEK